MCRVTLADGRIPSPAISQIAEIRLPKLTSPVPPATAGGLDPIGGRVRGEGDPSCATYSETTFGVPVSRHPRCHRSSPQARTVVRRLTTGSRSRSYGGRQDPPFSCSRRHG
jgi:hypothetical protein